MKSCVICGEPMQGGAIYKAASDDGAGVREFPALECTSCHYLEPDADRIADLPSQDVPSSVKLRCVKHIRLAS